MKKCCYVILIPKIKYRASMIDSIGLAILLGFFLNLALLISWVASESLVSSIEVGNYIG